MAGAVSSPEGEPASEQNPPRRPAANPEEGPGDEWEPDPRFTFANERTYLAWSRTALALIGGGLAVAQFVKVGVAGMQLIVAIPLIALGAFIAFSSYRQWQRNESALRVAEPLPASGLAGILVWGLVVFAIAACTLAIIHAASG